MKCYRFKHIPTGMYWRPSRDVAIKSREGLIQVYCKSNLSKKGKIYADKPSWRWLKWGFYDHVTLQKSLESLNINDNWIRKDLVTPFVQSDWILEEI